MCNLSDKRPVALRDPKKHLEYTTGVRRKTSGGNRNLDGLSSLRWTIKQPWIP